MATPNSLEQRAYDLVAEASKQGLQESDLTKLVILAFAAHAHARMSSASKEELRAFLATPSDNTEMHIISPSEPILDIVTERLNPEDLQTRRDEVRMMVAAGEPSNGISTYRGKRSDGPPIDFLIERYRRYLPDGETHTLFMHDLRFIDPPLAQAVENESRGRGLPIGTKSTLIQNLANGLYDDGAGADRRIRAAKRYADKLKNT